jgi:hypothetical protein
LREIARQRTMQALEPRRVLDEGLEAAAHRQEPGARQARVGTTSRQRARAQQLTVTSQGVELLLGLGLAPLERGKLTLHVRAQRARRRRLRRWRRGRRVERQRRSRNGNREQRQRREPGVLHTIRSLRRLP